VPLAPEVLVATVELVPEDTVVEFQAANTAPQFLDLVFPEDTAVVLLVVLAPLVATVDHLVPLVLNMVPPVLELLAVTAVPPELLALNTVPLVLAALQLPPNMVLLGLEAAAELLQEATAVLHLVQELQEVIPALMLQVATAAVALDLPALNTVPLEL